MTLAEMIEDVRERLGERVEDFHLTSAITRYLNQGRRRFCSEEKWDWLFTTQSGISLPAGQPTLELIDEVVVNRHFGLVLTKAGDDNLYLPEKVSPAKGLELRQQYRSAGRPQWWYTTGVISNDYGGGVIDVAQIVRLVPVPEVTYTAEYNFFRRPTLLTTTTQEDTDVPEDYQDGIVAWATAMCWQKELDHPGKANEQFGLYADVLRQARSHHNETSADRLVVWGKDAPEYPNNGTGKFRGVPLGDL